MFEKSIMLDLFIYKYKHCDIIKEKFNARMDKNGIHDV